MEFKDLVKQPKSLGFDTERLQLIDGLIKRGMDDKLYPSAVYVVMRHGMVAAHNTFGFARPDIHPATPAVIDTIYDMASVTKSITGTLLMMAIEQGLVQLSQTVAGLLPEAEHSPLSHVSLRQLATHTSGLPAWKPLYKLPADSVLEEILKTPLETEIGTKYTYSDLGYILIGIILSRLTGKTLDKLAHEQVFAPLGMASTGYNPEKTLYPRIAATGHSKDREGETIVGVVHDENAHSMGGVAGHAGVFSSAADMCRFALALQYPSTASHFGIPPVLGAAAKHVSQHSLIDARVGSHGVGWFIAPNPYLPPADLMSARAFGHSGFTGTLLMFDPEYDLTLILLTNRVYNPGEGLGVLRLRRLFVNVAIGAINA